MLDELARKKVREAAADEIYVKDPVLMVVEPESLCWLSGRMSEEVSGEAWLGEFTQLPNLEQVMRLSTRIWVMRGGRVVDGIPTDPARKYGETPYSGSR